MSLLTNLISYWSLNGNSNDAVGTLATLDSYPDSNCDTDATLYHNNTSFAGQAFTTPNDGISYALDSCKFYLKKGGSLTGNMYAQIYAMGAGTYGTDGRPATNSLPLAQSEAILVQSLTTSYQDITFNFTGRARIALAPNTHYVIVVCSNNGDISNYVNMGVDGSSPSHSGDFCYGDGGVWTGTNSYDTCFYVYGVSGNNGTDTAIDYLNPIDSYSESNQDGVASLSSANNAGLAQSFTNGITNTLDKCKFYIKKTGSPIGNAVAKLYAHSGTYGTSSIPTGSALATSDNFDVSTLGTSYALATFTFSGANRIALSASTYYEISIEYTGGDGSNRVDVGFDSSSPTASGNGAYYYGGTWTVYVVDLCFYVYGTANELLSGKINQGAGFNGTTSKITIANNSSLQITSSQSYAMWIKIAAQPATNTQYRLYDNSGSNPFGMFISYRDSGGTDILTMGYGTSGTAGFSLTQTLSLSTWYHLVFVHDDTNNIDYIYVNGVGTSSSSQTDNPGAQVSSEYIGCETGNGKFVNGSIDEVGIWSRALTSGEVSQLWNGGAGLAYPLTTNIVYTMVTAPASFSYTPQSSGDPVTRFMTTAKATFTLTGIATGFKTVRKMITAPATYVLTGLGAGFHKAYVMITAPATYVLTGLGAGFHKVYVMITAPATFILTGMSVFISKSGIIKPIIKLVNIIKPKLNSTINKIKITIVNSLKPKLK